MPKKANRISVPVKDKTLDRITRLAEQGDRSKANVAEIILEQGVELVAIPAKPAISVK